MTSSARVLSPTLWRTCRALANRRRLRIAQHLLQHPRSTVSDVAEALALPLPTASLYLRSLNARGLLRADPKGRNVRYRLGADPSVPQTAPLLRALVQEIEPPGGSAEKAFFALTGFTHARRILLLRILATGPLPWIEIVRRSEFSPRATTRHLKKLLARGYVVRCKEGFRISRPQSALAAFLYDAALQPVPARSP